MRESATPPCAPLPAVSSLDASGGPGVTVNKRASIASTPDPACFKSTTYAPAVYGVKFAAYVPSKKKPSVFFARGRVCLAVVVASALAVIRAAPPSAAKRTATAPEGAVTLSSNPSSPSTCRLPKWSRASTTKATGVPAGDPNAGVGPPSANEGRNVVTGGNTSPGTTVTVSPRARVTGDVPSFASSA